VVFVGGGQACRGNVTNAAHVEAARRDVEHKRKQAYHLVEPPGDEDENQSILSHRANHTRYNMRTRANVGEETERGRVQKGVGTGASNAPVHSILGLTLVAIAAPPVKPPRSHMLGTMVLIGSTSA
jgi:hypothetical protein